MRHAIVLAIDVTYVCLLEQRLLLWLQFLLGSRLADAHEVALLAEAHARQVRLVSRVTYVIIILRHQELILQIFWWILPFLCLCFTYGHFVLSFSLLARRCCLFLNAEIIVLLVIKNFMYLLLL